MPRTMISSTPTDLDIAVKQLWADRNDIISRLQTVEKIADAEAIKDIFLFQNPISFNQQIGEFSLLYNDRNLRVDNSELDTVQDIHRAASPSFNRIYVGDGTAALPSISFRNYTNKGFYSSGANSIGVSVGGALDFTFGLNAFNVLAGSHIEMADDTWIGSATVGGRIIFDSTPAIDQIEFMDCQVAVGHQAPDRLLHVEIDDASHDTVLYPFRVTRTTSDTALVNMGVGHEYELEDAGGTNDVAGTMECIWDDPSSGSEDSRFAWNLMVAGAGAAERMRLDGTGLAVGTSAPAVSALDIATGELTCGSVNRVTGTLTLEIGGTAEQSITSTETTFGGNIVIPDAGYIRSVSGSDAIQIEADGDVVFSQKVGIGRTPPAAPVLLEIYNPGTNHAVFNITCTHNTAHDPQIRFLTDATPSVKWSAGVDATDDALIFDNATGVGSATAALQLITAGYLGLGTAPDVKFHTIGASGTAIAWRNVQTGASGSGACPIIGMFIDDGAFLASGDRMGAFNFGDLSTGSAIAGVVVAGIATENWGAGAYGSKCDIEIVEDSSGSAARTTMLSVRTAGCYIPQDNKSLFLGLGGDFQLYHTGSYNIINAPNGHDFNIVGGDVKIGGAAGDNPGAQLHVAGTLKTDSVIYSESVIKILERAAAAASTANYGQLWVKNTTPCQLWFTDDAGNDTQIV